MAVHKKIPLPQNASRHPIPFICLIKRGNCTFDEKVRAAESGGYAAVIVFNHIDDSIFPMSSQSMMPVNIPSFMVGLTSGRRFIERFTNPYEDYIFEIYPNHSPYFEIYLIPVLSLLGLILLGLICLCIYRLSVHRRRFRRRGLTLRQVERLAVSKFVKGQTPDGTCVICLDDYEDGDELRHLPCGHVYHSKCVDPWLLKSSRSCPICKRRITSSTGVSRRRRRRLFFVSFRFPNRLRPNQPQDDQENHLVSDSDSNGTDYDDDDDARQHGSNPSVASPLPETSYGTVGSFAGHQRRVHHLPESPNESTPLLLPDIEITSRDAVPATHSAPPSLNEFAQNPFQVIVHDQPINPVSHLVTSFPDQPGFVLRSPQSSPNLYTSSANPQGPIQSSMDVAVLQIGNTQQQARRSPNCSL